MTGIPAIGEDIPLTHSCVISSRSLGYKERKIEPVLEAAAFHAARAGEKLRRKGLAARLVGVRIENSWAVIVILADLTDPDKGHAGLFDFAHREHDERRKKLMETVDRVNRLEGRSTIRFASQGAREPDWI